MTDPGAPGTPPDELPEVVPAEAAPEMAEPAAGEPADGGSEAVLEVATGPGSTRRRFRVGLPRSKTGLFALLLVLGGVGFAIAFTGASVLHWTETADFCGRCHQMEPELLAYEMGPHRDVACAECHVEPGVAGWIKAKVNGTRQLAEVILGVYPEPIPPPDHADLPSAEDTCMRCHSPSFFALSSLTTRVQFSEDEPNSRQAVGLLVRPSSGDQLDESRSVHWHVLREVDYWAPDEDTQSIDLIEATAPDGSIRTFIARDQVEFADDTQPEIDAIKASQPLREMSCYDCHNRVGHPIPNPRRSQDADMQAELIDAELPYIKREGQRLLWQGYPSVEAAEQEIAKLDKFYELNYPDVAEAKSDEIDQAIEQLQFLYRLTATPEMKVTAATYPDNIGHIDFPGCFRCHDGGHYLVKDGVVLDEAIPSACDTCHTFPQIGGPVATLPLGVPPDTHDDTLWVFNHKDAAPSVDPGGTSCGECHARDYCSSCHESGAIDVTHDEMAVNHAQVIREAPEGAASCAYCHQPAYCASCHTGRVMPGSAPWPGEDTEADAGGGETGDTSAGPATVEGAVAPLGPVGPDGYVHRRGATPSPGSLRFPLLVTGTAVPPG
jgi:nitrate/TMAO reductase-like tetraheme cytochrome c subunit